MLNPRIVLPTLIVLIFACSAAAQIHNPANHTADQRRAVRRTPVVDVFENSRDAVVNIAATAFMERRGVIDFDMLFDHMLDMRGPRTRVPVTSVGSGFVLDQSGYIVTNAHVVARTADRRVVFGDGTELDAEVIAMDVEHDLAILKVDAPGPLPELPLGRSDDLMVGETVIAIGNPFGFQHTVTSGVVSAIDREIILSDNLRFDGLIQTDASINPGNSGGPLLNVLGELIGVNTAIRGDAENIGFAIPVDQLRARLPELLSIERRYRVQTGLVLGNQGGHVVIASVAPGSAAADAGLAVGDVIETVDGALIEDAVDYHINLLGHRPGDMVDLKIARDAQPIITSIELRQRPLPDGAVLTAQRLGLRVAELSSADLARRGLRGESAIEIVDVESGSPASALEIAAGDLLVDLNGQMPTTLADLGMIWESIPAGNVVRLGFLRVTRRTRFHQTVNLRTR
ncbi:MAG: trypsin-like peptidase domain-containing protein [Phycisphaerales bacterium]